ncbi:ESCRT-I subunit protein VPS28 [Sugiyamaella lignohabitans]|uniref:Vacuolar protein sorting-associated protein 28 n=1 Tax=Sugiyamaella lignohabitans TaxID=796027 RepID=A0A167F3J4_9ASCO|nr:ESCRT-I subunit protein VPS28 [Sugiyamaella lignohabitans]ANB14783.1 ESCRT-I subunit protein VPS28 [Sugiyamaella lignohabitans]
MKQVHVGEPKLPLMNIPPPYAPANNSYGRVSNINLNEEVKLYTTAKQRELWESLAEIYSIIVTLDKLEKGYLRDSISHSEYTPACLRLLAQYNTILKNDEVSNQFGDLDSFKRKYNMDHASATSRLKIGVPATVEQAVDSPASQVNSALMPNGGPTPLHGGVSAKAVAEATGNFITTMDGLKLNFKAKDQLHPLLSELMTSLNKVTNSDFEGRGKIVQWLITLNGMKINEELSDEQVRQLMFDLDSAYKAFYTTLQ